MSPALGFSPRREPRSGFLWKKEGPTGAGRTPDLFLGVFEKLAHLWPCARPPGTLWSEDLLFLTIV